MIPALVVADDLTGAHVSAESLRRPGHVAFVVSAPMTLDQREVVAGLADVVVCSTGTRNTPPEAAAAVIRETLRQWWPAARVGKRIDSTLRGQIGAEVGALVRTLAELSGRRVLALVCAAHPAAGRTTLAGRQHLHGLPLDLSAASASAIEPLARSRILPLLEDGGLRGVEVGLDTVRGGAVRCAAAVGQALADGLDVVVLDGETLDDVDRAAASARLVAEQHPEVVLVCVDPGPFSARLFPLLDAALARPAAPALAVVGSASDLTRHQLARLAGSRPVRTVPAVEVAPSGGARLRPADAVALDLVRAAQDATPGSVLLLTSVATDAGTGPGTDAAPWLDPVLSVHVSALLGEVVRRFLDLHPVAGLLLTGGEVAADVLAALGARGVRPTAEVEPLAVRGVLVGGRWSGLPVVTKGGLVGDDDTLVRCVEQLGGQSAPDPEPQPEPAHPCRVSLT